MSPEILTCISDKIGIVSGHGNLLSKILLGMGNLNCFLSIAFHDIDEKRCRNAAVKNQSI